MFASAMSSSRIGAWPHHSDKRWPSTSRSSPSLRRYSKRSASFAVGMFSFIAFVADCCSEALQSARDLIELRVPINLLSTRIEEWSCFVARRRSNLDRRHEPYAHDAAAPRVNVTRVLQRHLRVSCMETSNVLVR